MIQVMMESDKNEEEENEEKSSEGFTFCTKMIFFSFMNIGFSSFVTPGRKTFFTKFSISTDFLDRDLEKGKNDPGHKSGLENLDKTVLVNNVAERSVKLIQDFNIILAIDETEEQFVLQIGNENSKTGTPASKSSVMKKSFSVHIMFLIQ